MIYAIEAVGLGVVKFGMAKNPAQRLYDLPTACPVDLKLLAKAPMSNWAEKFIHEVFAEEWTRGGWFKKSPRVERFIELLVKAEKEEHVLACCANYLQEEAEASPSANLTLFAARRGNGYQCQCADPAWCNFTNKLLEPA